MTLNELEQSFREFADDLKEPYLWSTDLVNSYAERAEIEACERRPLLMSSSIESLCSIAVTAGQSIYAKHSAVRQVFYAQFKTATETVDIFVTNLDEISFTEPQWKDLTGPPRYLILDDVNVQIVPPPTEDGTLEISVSHIPLVSIIDQGTPTINEAHHYNLVYWMLHLGYSKKDADTYSAKLALDYAGQFAAYFGEPKSVNAMKSVRVVREDRERGGWI